MRPEAWMCVLLDTLAHLSLGLLTWRKWSPRNVGGCGGGSSWEGEEESARLYK